MLSGVYAGINHIIINLSHFLLRFSGRYKGVPSVLCVMCVECMCAPCESIIAFLKSVEIQTSCLFRRNVACGLNLIRGKTIKTRIGF